MTVTVLDSTAVCSGSTDSVAGTGGVAGVNSVAGTGGVAGVGGTGGTAAVVAFFGGM